MQWWTDNVVNFNLKSIHNKIIFWALLPCFLVMAGITLLALITIKNTALEVVTNRDVVLAEFAAKRLSENLQKYPLFLQNIAESTLVKEMRLDRLGNIAAPGNSWLHFFDGGLILYDKDGTAVLSSNTALHFTGERFPDTDGFQELKNTLRPFFSNTLAMDNDQNSVIVIAVPVISTDNRFVGALAGVCSVNRSTIGATYSQVLEYESGKSSYAYLVDGAGSVLYHRHSSLIGKKVDNWATVESVTRGKAGAMVNKDAVGEMVISGFAPVPGTNWGVVTQGNWGLIRDMIQFYTRFFQLILWSGGLVISLLVVYFIQRLLEPIRDLTKGAELIAKGNFIEIPVKKTEDEIEVLSKQFNSMARAMKASFHAAEHRIIELNTARDEILRSEEKIRKIINAVNDILFMVDASGEVLWINEKGKDVFGFTVVGSCYCHFLYNQVTVPEDCFIRNYLEGGLENDRELRIQCSGKFLDYWCTVSAVEREMQGSVRSAVVVCRNMTEKKQLRAEVLRNAQLAALGELAAGVAHEINNPITGIINYAQIIEDSWGKPDNKHDQLPKWIINEGARIAIIVSKLLSFARRDVEKKQAVFIFDVLDDVLNLTGTLLKKEHIQVEMDLPKDLPPIRAVIHQVQQIFLNIISNARYALNVKYPGQDSGKTIRVEALIVHQDSESRVRIIFTDSGTGIAGDVLDKVCNPFFSTKPPEQGTGLGLSISYGIIEEHHGGLTVESEEGAWTRVTVDFPVWQKQE